MEVGDGLFSELKVLVTVPTLLNNVLALLIRAKAQIKRLEIEHHHNARVTGVVIQLLRLQAKGSY